jgi:hypothetical protein
MVKRQTLYTLRVELLNIEPLIWRRIQVEGKASLAALHHVVQAAFGWSDAHLHEFDVGGRLFGNMKKIDTELREDVLDERKEALSAAAVELGATFGYAYDFGDGWEHRIVVERVDNIDEPMGYARVLAGERACPPEDVGGPGGYDALVTAITSAPESEEAKGYFDWVGVDYDPEQFDRHAANAALLRMAWNGWGTR